VTLKVTHFVNMPHPMLKKDAIGANATTTIKRTEFGVNYMVPNIPDEMTINLFVEGVRK
jgi:polyisoprenoid-binding protein YceI